MQLILDRLQAAFTKLPPPEGWLLGILVLLIFSLAALAIGFYFKFLRFTSFQDSWILAVLIALRSFLTPALLEETLFRVLLLPHPQELASPLSVWIWGGMGLIIFILYHPLQALTTYSTGRPIFMDSVFLLLAGLLGGACTVVYEFTGSVWLPTCLHWLVVVVWLLFLGGYQKLRQRVE